MDKINIDIPTAVNETVRDYIPGSPECISLKSKLSELENEAYEIPIIIGGKEIHSGNNEGGFGRAEFFNLLQQPNFICIAHQDDLRRVFLDQFLAKQSKPVGVPAALRLGGTGMNGNGKIIFFDSDTL